MFDISTLYTIEKRKPGNESIVVITSVVMYLWKFLFFI